MTRADVIVAVVAWLRASCASTPLTTSQIVRAGQPDAWPPMPFLTVRVGGSAQGEDQEREYAGDLDVSIRESRVWSVEVNGYGAQTEQWLLRARASLWQESTIATLTTAGMTLNPSSDVQDLTELLDTAEEPRFLLTVEAGAIVSGLDSREAVGLDTTTTTTTIAPVPTFEVTTP